MVADKGKKLKAAEKGEDEIDVDLVVSIEKLQEIQDDLEKVIGPQFVMIIGLYFSLACTFFLVFLSFILFDCERYMIKIPNSKYFHLF